MKVAVDAMTVLLLGSGGREHALAWKLAQSERVRRIVAAPGNPGIGMIADTMSIDINDPAAVVALARSVPADLVVVGPEAPLAEGVADALIAAGIPVFGPIQAAARLEWDKSFAKDFMVRHGIAAAASQTFSASQLDEATRYVASHELPIVVKASGLAAGKGVVVATTHEEARQNVEAMLSGVAFGDAGTTVIIEEFMNGEEVSVFAISDGSDYVVLAPSQDHKRVGDNDTGPNTGGMGAYAPAPIMTDALLARVRTDVIDRALEGMRSDGTPFVGCLYAGLMIDGSRVRVVEFNCRFGDPETQVVLPLYRGDLAELLYAAATGTIASVSPAQSRGTAACVVVASPGYPGSYPTGAKIDGLDAARDEHVMVFHAGTRSSEDGVVTSGGRVLAVAAYDDEGDLERVLDRAYAVVQQISFEGAHYRRDIGHRALERSR